MKGLVKSLSELMRSRQLPAGRVYLRPPARSDWRRWAALREESRAFLQPWEPTWAPDTLTRKAFARRLKAYAMNAQADVGYALLMFRATDGALVGGISLNHVRRGNSQSASIGYWMGQPHTGQGYMTEAVAGLLPFAFDRLRLQRLSAACLPHNTASRRVLGKVGFMEEGFARRYLRINGEWRDHVIYAMLNTDARPLTAAEAPKRAARRFKAEINEVLARTASPKLGAGGS